MPRLLASLAVVFWGISFVATKAALAEVSPITVIFLRFAIGAALLFAIVRSLPPRRSWPGVVLIGFIGVFVHQMLQAYGLTMTTASNTGWIIGLTPIWSALLAVAAGREKFGFWKVVGLVGGFAGALLVMTKGNFSVGVFTLPSTRGDLLIVLSTVNWAVYSVIGHRTIRDIGPRHATSGAMIAGVALLAPFFVAAQGWREMPRLTVTGWSAILFLGVCCSALGYLFWYNALQHLEVSRVAALLYAEPLVTFAAAVLLLGERVSTVVIAGGVLVILSVLISQYAPARFGAGRDSAVTPEEA